MAARTGPVLVSSGGGYTRTGFVDYGSSAGQWVEWTVNQASAGNRTLMFRYDNGASSDRPLELRVNGQVVNSRVAFGPTGTWGTWKTLNVNAPLAAGANKIQLTSLGAGPNIDSLSVSGTGTQQPVPPPPQPQPQPQPQPPAGGTYEAEAATRSGPGFDNSTLGYTGTGFVDYGNTAGQWVEWAVGQPGAATRALTFRYANGSASNRPLDLRVNGQLVGRVAFAPTGSWRTWKMVSVSAPLAAGANKVRLTSVGAGPNVDSLAVSGVAAQPAPTAAERLNHALDFAAAQLRRTAAEIPTDRYVNYTNADGTWHVLPDPAWEAGFLPGSMWQLYQRTGDTYWKDQATARSLPLEVERDRRYDTSFVVYRRFKPLYDQTGNPEYRQVMLDAAAAKAGWFHERIGAFRGWVRRSTSGDPRAQTGFYVDLMADLELFIWAAKETGNTQWLDMARRHANTTAGHLVRADGSTIQWGYFEDATGAFVKGEQYQGYDDQSTWSRGQAWAIYGFSLAYRELGDPRFLAVAKKTADWYLAHLPADKVPYWDFNDPKIPNAYRDTSAAAIAASGLLDLAKQLSGTADGARYRAAAEATLVSLACPSFLAEGTNSHGVLRHAALNVPTGVGTDTSLVVGDYFFLEGINRYFAK